MPRKIITELNTAADTATKSVKTDSIRPQTLDSYIGQTALKRLLEVYISAAKSRNECLDHILLYGPPGLGKTTLAGIIANEMGKKIRITSGPAIEKAGELAALLSTMADGDILFIDEIHRLDRSVEEVLYAAMEDYAIDIMLGKNEQAKSVRLTLPHFTLIGATTRAGLLSAPLRDRFGIIGKMEYYSDEELKLIAMRTAKILHIGIEEAAAGGIAKRSRGTPRLANRLVKRVRDHVQVCYHSDIITGEMAEDVLNEMGIDENGLDTTDHLIIDTISEQYGGGPVGLSALADTIGEDVGTLEDVYEPYLIKKGIILRTQRGRMLAPEYK